MEENTNEVQNFQTNGKVALPFNEKQFKDFIVSLLGKPQTISKFIRGTFEIDKENLISLFEVINQRIYQQNDAKLIQFRASIYYDDNSTVTLNGFDHLVSYNEKLPLVSKAVHLTWQYLVKFRDKETFEKQEISISFLTESDGPVPIFDDEMRNRFYETGINFRISHTARTWGADIEGMLTKQLKTIIKKDSKILNYFRYNDDNIKDLLSAVLVAITLIYSLINTFKLKNSEKLVNDPTAWIHHYGNYIFLFSGIFILIKVTNSLLEEFQVYGSPSFILLTSESLKEKNKRLKKNKGKWIRYIGTMIISLILGIVTNYIYHYLTN